MMIYTNRKSLYDIYCIRRSGFYVKSNLDFQDEEFDFYHLSDEELKLVYEILGDESKHFDSPVVKQAVSLIKCFRLQEYVLFCPENFLNQRSIKTLAKYLINENDNGKDITIYTNSYYLLSEMNNIKPIVSYIFGVSKKTLEVFSKYEKKYGHDLMYMLLNSTIFDFEDYE